MNYSWAQPDDVEVLQKRLDIVKIHDSTNDIDLRIYLSRGFTNSGHVLWIRRKGEKWLGTKFDYYLKIKRNGETGRINKINSQNLLPYESWSSLWSSLVNSNIKNLPNQEEIKDKLRKEVTTTRGKGYEIINVVDGSGYHLTLKDGADVITYNFHSPWIYKEKFPEVEEVKNYSDIISTLEKHLDINFRN